MAFVRFAGLTDLSAGSNENITAGINSGYNGVNIRLSMMLEMANATPAIIGTTQSAAGPGTGAAVLRALFIARAMRLSKKNDSEIGVSAVILIVILRQEPKKFKVSSDLPVFVVLKTPPKPQSGVDRAPFQEQQAGQQDALPADWRRQEEEWHQEDGHFPVEGSGRQHRKEPGRLLSGNCEAAGRKQGQLGDVIRVRPRIREGQRERGGHHGRPEERFMWPHPRLEEIKNRT